jgi:hypothetical protein
MEAHGLRRCRFEIDDERCRAKTVFDDGSELVAAPVMDPENVARARSLGDAGSDEEAGRRMTRYHDLVHTLRPRPRASRSRRRCTPSPRATSRLPGCRSARSASSSSSSDS